MAFNICILDLSTAAGHDMALSILPLKDGAFGVISGMSLVGGASLNQALLKTREAVRLQFLSCSIIKSRHAIRTLLNLRRLGTTFSV